MTVPLEDEIMKVLLIAPASGKWHGIGRSWLFGGRVFRFSLLSLLSVAADTPAGVEVQIVDEQVQDIPTGERFDLVGITCMTAAAPRAYVLADFFRRRGFPVVLGGTHPTLMPEEALTHADAICVGEAEGVWPRIIEDARAGKLKGVYRGVPRALNSLALPPRQLLDSRHYGTVQAVQATRGCPNRCAFCTVSAFHEGRFRCRPVSDVVAEVAALPDRFFVFVDDNLTANRDYARELLRALRPLDKLWISQSTLDVTDDLELVRLAAQSGCIGLFVGLETFSAANLVSVEKGFNRVNEYRDRISTLHAHGIGVEAGIVFGFERDDPSVFQRTLTALDDLAIDMVQVSILTPLPGTAFHDSMRVRIFDRDWSHYDFHHVVFEPRRMSAEDLQAGHDWVTYQFYRPWRIARRLARMARRPGSWRVLPYAAAINLAYYGRTQRWNVRGWDPSGSARLRPVGATSADAGERPRNRRQAA
ncbi:MAG: B12-binding domain-containing radical SAM protein [Acidobacteriota bacterium]|nr:MAG: B12-binding domain-containing radical SAM protein [Acidobacteriota bacterium]